MLLFIDLGACFTGGKQDRERGRYWGLLDWMLV